MDTSQRRWPPWVSATGRCTLEIWEALAVVCFNVLCLCLREKATLMTGPSKLKGSSGGGCHLWLFWGGEGHLTCSPLPISDQVCMQFCYSIISRLYTKTPSLIPGYLRSVCINCYAVNPISTCKFFRLISSEHIPFTELVERIKFW